MRALLRRMCAAGVASILAAAGCTEEDAAGSYSGYYRQGFEQSDFYTLDGHGPWWVDAGESEWAEFMAHMVPAPGRGSAVTVRMKVEGQLQTGGGFGHIGRYDKRLFVTRIVDIEPVSAEQYQAAVAGFRVSPSRD